MPQMTALGWILASLAAVAVLLVLDRLLLAAEARGTIYYRRRKASPGSLGSAMLEIHASLQPSMRHIAEEQRRIIEIEDAAGEPPPGQ